jgi:hypothetical protein
MPNISICQLSINLPEADGSQAMRQNRWDLMKKLRDELDEHSEEFDILNILRPEPKDIGDGWYRWRCDNWGTKWSEIQDYQLEPDLHLVQFTLATAWGPPLELCEYLTDELDFEVRCVYASVENCDWGIWDQWGQSQGEVRTWSSDDFENLRDILEDCEDYESKFDRMVDIGIFREDCPVDYIKEWIVEEWRGIFEDSLDQYEEWLEGQPDHTEMMQMKQKVLSHTEELLEKGEITEGDYLKLCNKLKTMSKEQLVLIIREANPEEFGKL